MTTGRVTDVLFIQGGGDGTHDEWDNKLADSLARELGPAFRVRYPRMPEEGDPTYRSWAPAIRAELAKLDDGAVVVGHSVGGTLLVQTLVDGPPDVALRALVLIAAPFVGTGGWSGDEFELPADLGARLPPGIPVELFFGLADDTTPPPHADLYARRIPAARVHALLGRDHQLGNDLTEVATIIRDRVSSAASTPRTP